MASLAELLAMAEDKPRNTILPEAAIATLKEAHERILAGNPFKVGDIVTPRKDAPIKGAGEPHLVIGVQVNGYERALEPAGDWAAAAVFDIKLLRVYSCGDVVPHLAPSWVLEPFTE